MFNDLAKVKYKAAGILKKQEEKKKKMPFRKIKKKMPFCIIMIHPFILLRIEADSKPKIRSSKKEKQKRSKELRRSNILSQIRAGAQLSAEVQNPDLERSKKQFERKGRREREREKERE